jgi:ADP-heptose:LPS heptosyltransferase
MKSIALYRPGAIGDILMILNSAPKLRRIYDKIDLYCHKSTLGVIGNFCKESELVDEVLDMDNFDSSGYSKTLNCVGYPLSEGYPNVPMKKHLIEYFAEELDLDISFDDVRLPPLKPPFEVSKKPLYITVQTKTGWSTYKEWWGWQKLIDKLKDERPDIGVYQIGGPDDPKLLNIDGDFLGHSFDTNLASQIWSKLHIGVDSVFNHTSNYLWHGIGKKNCVILWGSTQYKAAGYRHNTNISLNLPCQPCFREDPAVSQMSKGVCPNPEGQTYENPKHACMAGISVDMVYNAIMEKI